MEFIFYTSLITKKYIMRLAFVVQRYGSEVNGGAEYLCRWVAERMRQYFAVEVLTTCALDYLTWENHFPTGISTLHGITVHRFATDAPRDIKKFAEYNRQLFDRRPPRALADELTWLKLQGPLSSALLRYIKDHADAYDLFVFVTYSYLTTFLGLQLVPQKSVLIPAAHDEPHFDLAAWQPIFHLPRGLIFSTVEERRLVHQRWHNSHIPSCIAGVGVETAPAAADENLAPPPFLPQTEEYLLYMGRVDIMKGCRELLTYFLRYLKERARPIHLVLLGQHALEVPRHPQIHAPGFVPATQKMQALQGATLVINPSAYESLSLLLLEAWQAGVPVLVNAASDVLVEHCLKSNGGFYYSNYNEFALCLDLLLANASLRKGLGQNGQRYVAENYALNTVEKIYVDFLTQLAQAE